MNSSANANDIVRQLRIVFSISIVLLVISLFASFVSTSKLIENSRLVNHTNEVLIQSENIISYMKDAETGQRGYLVSHDPVFLEPYAGAYQKVVASYRNVEDLTIDNPVQQKNIQEIKAKVETKFAQMDAGINIIRKYGDITRDSNAINRELMKGKKIMDELRLIVQRIKIQEKELLDARLEEQNKYINISPILLLIAAVISILITAFAYVRIRKDMELKAKQQKEEEDKYRQTSQRISQMEIVTRKVSEGDYAVRSADNIDDDLGRVAIALNKMTLSLENTFKDLSDKSWLQAGAVNLGNDIRGQRNIDELAKTITGNITSYVHAPLSTLYIISDDGTYFSLKATYGQTNAPRQLKPGEGLAGEVAKRKESVFIDHLPNDYIQVSSSLGQALPTCLLILPLVYSGECIGIVELGFLKKPSLLEIEFLKGNAETLAIAVNAALDYHKLQNFLEETQTQSEELQTQHSELENMNHELEIQSQKLQASEEELRVQQEELQQTNEELEERSALLEEKNIEIQKKAEELQITSKYKSEFLANMSHELRTPLNSVLLLSRLLSENPEKTLNDEQVEYANVIQSSGQGLLSLIDEILDLSKIEAGKMDLEFAPVILPEISNELSSLFKALAREKKIEFKVSMGEGLPVTIESDKTRLEQILKNLISNAIKFTSNGSVSLEIQPDEKKSGMINFAVRDTGIGIAADKQHLVFEAFQQADGSTKRKYGGTGLGLSISRELAKLLGGEISLTSELGQGSLFILSLPVKHTGSVSHDSPVTFDMRKETMEKPAADDPKQYRVTTIPENIPDDRDKINPEDKVILIVEDDINFAKSLLAATRKKGYKGVVAVRGDEGITLAGILKPHGILLDIQLPVKSGWEVMDELKSDPKTRHIPVHIMSSHKLRNESLLKGAVDFIDKPFVTEQMQEVFKKIEYVLSHRSNKVLIIEDNPKHAKALAYFLETFNVHSELQSDVSQAIESLKDKKANCVILDMGIPDAKAYNTLEEAKRNRGLENLPIIVFTGKSLSLAEELKIKKYADSIVVKTAHSYQRMLDEVSLFLHLVEDKKQKPAAGVGPKKLGALSEVLEGKTILITDDDVRNVFSLSKALENYKMNILTAINGKEALQVLKENPSIDVVLLDMMMPEMDGYETATKIREHSKWKNLPVIAVTAKAMIGDREKCINAGASDYITKPVDLDQLISLLRVWLYERV
jgi:signal transduction histidine kinase/CheY-like chemotaxis protein/CHASE3 domain sensor protein